MASLTLDKFTFVTFTILGRLVQGVGSSLVSATITSILLNFYQIKLVRSRAAIGIAIALGMMCGPLIGEGLYFIGGF